MVRRLGAVQLDTISVLARSHELVAYARHGAVGRAAVERAYWGKGSATFEYWSHAACVIPLEDWPLYGFKRRARRAKGKRWHHLADRERSCAEVMARLRAEGPLTANELGGAKKSGTWWDWSETKIAAEWLLDIGDLVCRERRGFQRVYDLAERAIPAALRESELSDEECAVRLVAAAGRSLGLGTLGDLAVYHGLPQRLVRQVLPGTELRAGQGAGLEAAGLRRSRPPSARSGGGPRGGACCFRRSTRSVGTGTASSGSSGCATAWRPTRRGRSAPTATSPCRCWAMPRSSVWSIRGAATVRWWPSRSRSSRPRALDHVADRPGRRGALGRVRPGRRGAGGARRRLGRRLEALVARPT